MQGGINIEKKPVKNLYFNGKRLLSFLNSTKLTFYSWFLRMYPIFN